MPPLSDESRIVRQGQRTLVRLTPFGRFLAAAICLLLSLAYAIWRAR